MKQFRSPGADIRVSSTSGHVAIITKDLRPLHQSLWAQAYTLGALSEDMKEPPSILTYLAEKKEEAIVQEEADFAAIKKALLPAIANPSEYLNAKNELIYRKTISLIGKPVKKDVIEKAWEELINENT